MAVRLATAQPLRMGLAAVPVAGAHVDVEGIAQPLSMSSVLKKRRKKMNKHKYKKRMKKLRYKNKK